ncbi:tRNA-dependent cyclodipeptide synthase [Nonomuraea sp. M3C6]|uniref:Cyclodipeptide synthase n=1 Tax=Nonomuraea marmarensis TaxID=3351344 RepID=A0ABW7AY46_9ACTN
MQPTAGDDRAQDRSPSVIDHTRTAIVAEGLAARPISRHCVGPFLARSHACLGISPFNGYFTTERITELAAWALRTFSAVHLFVPDVPAAMTLQALGYPPDRAATKARRQAGYLRNKICRALETLRVAEPTTLILDWAALSGNPVYSGHLRAVSDLFDSDVDFQETCLEATRWVLEGRLKDSEITRAQLRLAVDYLLAELPLFIDTATIVGQSASVFCYHQATPFLQRLYGRELAVRPVDRQGFAVLAPGFDQGMTQ